MMLGSPADVKTFLTGESRLVYDVDVIDALSHEPPPFGVLRSLVVDGEIGIMFGSPMLRLGRGPTDPGIVVTRSVVTAMPASWGDEDVAAAVADAAHRYALAAWSCAAQIIDAPPPHYHMVASSWDVVDSHAPAGDVMIVPVPGDGWFGVAAPTTDNMAVWIEDARVEFEGGDRVVRVAVAASLRDPERCHRLAGP